MNTSHFIVAGAVEKIGEASGYDIEEWIKRLYIDRWTDIKKGSIFHSISFLEKHMYLIPRVPSFSKRPKTLYSISPEGQVYFDILQHEAFLGIFPKFFGFLLALKLNTRKSSSEINEYGRQAVERIESLIFSIDKYLQHEFNSRSSSPLQKHFVLHERRMYENEKAWINEALTYL